MNTIIEWIQSWTMDGKLAILLFPVVAIALLFSSLRIVKYSEVIIAKSKFGGGFVGATLIATVTSIPELVTELTQAGSNTPQNGMGDDIGSNAFSIFLIGVAAFIAYKYMFLNKLGKWTRTSIIISFFMTVALSVFLMISRWYRIDIPTGVGLIPLAFFLFFLFTIYLVWKYDDSAEEEIDVKFVKHHTLRSGIIWFCVWAVVVVVFAVLLNLDVDAFAAPKALNIPSESAGGVFLAITTSLPEVVAFFAFLKKRQPAAAIASLVGSHFFNIGISFFGDLVYHKKATFNALVKDTGEAGNPAHDHYGALSHHYPLAILTAGMLILIIAHFLCAKKWPTLWNKKSVYFAIPTLIVVGYVVGWAMIIAFNR